MSSARGVWRLPPRIFYCYEIESLGMYSIPKRVPKMVSATISPYMNDMYVCVMVITIQYSQ